MAIVPVDLSSSSSLVNGNPINISNLPNSYAPTNVQNSDAYINASTAGIVSSSQAASFNSVSTTISSVQPSSAVQPTGINTAPANTSIQNTNQPTKLQNFEANVLDGYDNVTYHFRLSITNELDALNVDQEPQGPFYVIAESGVTSSFYINDVDIESYVSPNGKTKITRSTVCSMKIVEPQGCSLVDKLLFTAKQLNIANPRAYPLILDLTFKGYDSSTGLPQEVTIGRHSWRMVMTNIETSLNEGGSEYKIEMNVLGDLGFFRLNPMNIIQQPIDMAVTGTLKDFFHQLSLEVNEQLRTSNQQAKNLPTTTINLNIDQSMQSWVIGQSASTPNQPSQFVDMTNGKPSFKLPAGAMLTDIVASVLANTKEGQQAINPSSIPNNQENTNPVPPNISKVPWITSKVEYTKSNVAVNDYDKIITFYISLYDSPRVVISKPVDQTPDRLQYLAGLGLLRKKYQYYFTGENLDILHWDLSLQNLWVNANIMYAEGIQRTNNESSNKKTLTPQVTTVNDTAPTNTTNGFSAQNSTDVDYLTQITDSPYFNPTTSTIQANPYKSTASSNTLSAADKQNTLSPSAANSTNLSTLVAGASQSSNPIQVQATNASNTPNNVPVLLNNSSRISPGSSPSMTPQGSTLLQSNGSQEVLIETLGNGKILISDFYTEKPDIGIDTNKINKFFEPTTDSAKTIFGAVMNQITSPGHDTDLLSINLEIRGDPFWLGESETAIFQRLDNQQFDLTSQKPDTANYLIGENQFFLTFKTPQNYDENTGFVTLQNADLFIGLYSVLIINHIFSEGKFTQKIQAARDMTTDVSQISKFIQ